MPFHAQEAIRILSGCRRTICVEANFTAQFARHLRAETGFSVSDRILKYDGEPFEPRYIFDEVRRILAGRAQVLDVTPNEAREMAYHYIRTHLNESLRPGQPKLAGGNGLNEDVWHIEIVHRESGERSGDLRIGLKTGATHGWAPVADKAVKA